MNEFFDPDAVHFIESPLFCGSSQQIHRLPSATTRERLDDLVHGRQIAASADGKTVVVILSSGPAGEVLTHSRISLPNVRFDRGTSASSGTRIVEVTEGGLTLWGKPMTRDVRGIYRRSGCVYRLVAPLDELLEVRRNASTTVILGRCNGDEPGTMRAITPYGTLNLPVGSIVAPLASGSVQIVQWVSDTTYRYELGPDGFDEIYPVPMRADEKLIGMVNMHGLKVMCLSGEHVSRLVGVGKLRHLLGPEGSVQLLGRLESVWQSPSGASVAWLIRRTEHGLVRRTLCLNGAVVHEGSFTMRNEDLRWSPNEQHIGAAITLLQPGRPQEIVTTHDHRIMDAGVLSDFLVDSEGFVAARLTIEEGVYTPRVYRTTHPAVPFAWNLMWREGRVHFNSVIDTSVLATSDTTNMIDPYG